MSEAILEKVQADTKAAMRAGEKQTTAALRMISSALQGAAKDGDDDAVAVLQRERKKRLEAAEAYEKADRSEQAAAERAEAKLIATYLPEQISDEDLAALVDAAIADSGADSMQQMGQVIGVVMGQVKGRADGKRVSGAVRDRLGS